MNYNQNKSIFANLTVLFLSILIFKDVLENKKINSA